MNMMRKFSLASRSLRHKLFIVLSLMSIIPILVLCNYVFPHSWFIPFFRQRLFYITTFLSLLGFWMLKEIIDSILKISSEAKIIAHGDYSKIISVKREDEIGDLSVALNQLTTRIKSNMQELRQYSEKTKDINFEIHKRVSVLSSLLQVSNFISQGEKLDSILQLIIEKLTQTASSTFSCYLATQEKIGDLELKVASGIDKNRLSESNLKAKQRFFSELLEEKTNLTIDSQSPSLKDVAELREFFGTRNILLFAVTSREKTIGILCVGNNTDNFIYKPEDLEIVDIFAKQIAVAIENDLLQKKVKSLEIKDALTGLYNKTFIEQRLDDEIKKAIAYQKPCAFILLDVENFKEYNLKFGALATELVLKRVAALLESVVSDIDLAGRIGDNEFAVILPAKNKRQAIVLAEDIRKKNQELFSREANEERKIALNSGVSENPLDGMDGNTLISKARDALFGAAVKIKEV